MSTPGSRKLYADSSPGSPGGQVLINHDVELAFASLQARIRAALAQPSEIAARLRFERGEKPAILDVGGARILVTHGEHPDGWNRVDYRHLPEPECGVGADAAAFTYAPGSRLVKMLMNPFKRQYGLYFIDLIKPDFQGGVLTALSVNPLAVRAAFQGATAKLFDPAVRLPVGAQSASPALGARTAGTSNATWPPDVHSLMGFVTTALPPKVLDLDIVERAICRVILNDGDADQAAADAGLQAAELLRLVERYRKGGRAELKSFPGLAFASSSRS